MPKGGEHTFEKCYFPYRREFGLPVLGGRLSSVPQRGHSGPKGDAVRERFGMDAVMRAAFLNQPIDHMSGGISREKREVDYEKIAVL